jgi:hypothetical protein
MRKDKLFRGPKNKRLPLGWMDLRVFSQFGSQTPPTIHVYPGKTKVNDISTFRTHADACGPKGVSTSTNSK